MLKRKTMKNSEIYNSANQLIGMFDNVTLPVKVNFYLQKNVNTIIEMGREIEKARVEIIQKYGEPLEDNPDQYTVKPENLAAANKELTDLFGLEQEVKVNMINIDSFGDLLLTSAQTEAILFMIEEDEEEM